MNELTQEQQDAIAKFTAACQDMYDAVKIFVEKIMEAIKPIFEWLIKTLGPICKNLPYYTKHSMIYYRTKSKRIRKKQISLMRKKGFIC